MTDDAKADLSLIARQQRQLLTEMNTLRDDMTVLTAIVQRLDGTLAGLVNEIRATHAQQSRMDRRVSDLEKQSESSA
jgi:predicted  nucleic acid-binding Zn-ribbon protein